MIEPAEAAIGLCARCVHARTVETPRSRFWLCERSRTDPAYPRYPRLPVTRCAGHEPLEPGRTPPPVAPDRRPSG